MLQQIQQRQRQRRQQQPDQQLEGHGPVLGEKSSHRKKGKRKKKKREEIFFEKEGDTAPPTTKDVPIYGGETTPWVTVHHDLLPPQSLHQECATAQWRSKLILAGGINGSLQVPADQVLQSTIGGQVTTVYDMASMNAALGPPLPWRGNHNIGAITSNGMFHVTGGFRQDAQAGEPLAYSLHAAWDVRSGLASSTPTGTWRMLAPMLHPRGAHTCKFFGDGRMYCVGGGSAQSDHHSTTLQIYDPVADAWELGPDAPTARDHITSVAFSNGRGFWVLGGRGSIGAGERKWHPSLMRILEDVEAFHLDTNKWTSHPPMPIGRGAMMEAPFRRKNVKGRGHGHNVLLAGGERHYHQSGAALDTLQEFDPARGVFFCHPSLPYPVFGGVAGVHEGKLHVVGGAEWWFVSGTRRVQVFDVESAPLPTPCVYQYSPLNMSVFRRSAHPLHPTPFDQMEYKYM